MGAISVSNLQSFPICDAPRHELNWIHYRNICGVIVDWLCSSANSLTLNGFCIKSAFQVGSADHNAVRQELIPARLASFQAASVRPVFISAG